MSRNGNDLSILLTAQLDTKISLANINTQIREMSKSLESLSLKIKIDDSVFKNLTTQMDTLNKSLSINLGTSNMSGEFDKLTQSSKYVDGVLQKVHKKVTETTDQFGQQVKLIEILNVETGKLEETEQHVVNNAKKRRLELEKINQAQSDYLSKRSKEKLDEMTSTPDGLKQLNQYYKELEKTLGTVEQTQKKVNQLQQDYWASVRQEKLSDMTSKSKELQDLARYYSILEKTSASTSAELAKLKNNAVATNNVLKNFGTSAHHQQADQLTNSLLKLNIAQDMTQKEMQETVNKAKELSHQLNNVSREAKATGNSSMTLSSMIGTAFEKFSV